MENVPLLISVQELRRLIGSERVGSHTLYRLARRYGVRLGKRWLIPRHVVLALLEGRLNELENPALPGGAE